MAHRYNRFNRGKRFIDLPRHKRADAVFKLKHRIREGDYANFDTHDYIEKGVSWCDAYFVGSDKFTFWNATITTATDRLYTDQTDAAHKQADALLSEEDMAVREQSIRGFFAKENAILHPNGMRSWPRLPAPKFERLGNLTYNEYVRSIERSIVIPVYEQIEMDYSYRYGIGLHVTLDVPLLTETVITEFVDRFVHELGEQSFRSDKPAQHIDGPVYMSNAIV